MNKKLYTKNKQKIKKIFTKYPKIMNKNIKLRKNQKIMTKKPKNRNKSKNYEQKN